MMNISSFIIHHSSFIIQKIMVYSVQNIHDDFSTIKPEYWLIREKTKNGMTVFDSDDLPFAEALERLNDGEYYLEMRTSKTAGRGAKARTFRVGEESVKGIGSTASNTAQNGGMNWGNSNAMMPMMFQMYNDSRKETAAILKELADERRKATEDNFTRQLELFKLQHKMKDKVSKFDKIAGIVTHPNLSALVGSVGALVNGGQPAAIGRATMTANVPPPSVTVTKNDVPVSEQDLTEEQQEAYNKGLRLKNILEQIQTRFPGQDPIAMLELGANHFFSQAQNPLDDDTTTA